MPVNIETDKCLWNLNKRLGNLDDYMRDYITIQNVKLNFTQVAALGASGIHDWAIDKNREAAEIFGETSENAFTAQDMAKEITNSAESILKVKLTPEQ